MPTVTLPNTIAVGTPRDVTKVQANFIALRDAINGTLDGDNFSTATRQALSLTDSSNVRRGHSLIATSESVAGLSYAALTTPDRVSSIVVPTNGVLHVSYWAVMTKTAGGSAETGAFGLFLNGTQVKSRFGSAPASGASAGLFEYATVFSGFGATVSAAIFTDDNDAGTNILVSGNGGPVDDTTNGHANGAFIPIQVAAGTYTVEMRFKKTSGATITVANRRLLVKAEAY